MNYIIRAISLAFVLLLGYSCQKNTLHDAPEETLPIKQVQEAFNIIQPTKPPAASRAPNANFNKPDWKQATWVARTREWSYWRIPLSSEEKIMRFTVIEDTEKQTRRSVLLPDPWLMVYEDSSKNLQFFVIQEEPGHDKKANSTNPTGFTGDLNIYTWTGTFQFGIGFENGIRKTRISKRKRGSSNASARWENVCNTVETCIYEAQCVISQGGIHTVVHAELRQVNHSPYMCPGTVAYTNHDEFYDENGVPIPSDAFISCDTEWSSMGSETTGSCEWKWIADGTDPNPDPGSGGGGNPGTGGGIGNVTDPNWVPILDMDPCQSMKYINQFISYPGVSSALTKVRQKLIGPLWEWGTPIWYTNYNDPNTLSSGNPTTAGSTDLWSYPFFWDAAPTNKYTISDIHSHPSSSPPSPADVLGLVENMLKVRVKTNNNNAQVKFFMQHASIIVVSKNAEWVITGGSWGQLFQKYQQFKDDPQTFNDQYLQIANNASDPTQALELFFGTSINILMTEPGVNDFIPITFNGNSMAFIPCD